MFRGSFRQVAGQLRAAGQAVNESRDAALREAAQGLQARVTELLLARAAGESRERADRLRAVAGAVRSAVERRAIIGVSHARAAEDAPAEFAVTLEMGGATTKAEPFLSPAASSLAPEIVAMISKKYIGALTGHGDHVDEAR